MLRSIRPPCPWDGAGQVLEDTILPSGWDHVMVFAIDAKRLFLSSFFQEVKHMKGSCLCGTVEYEIDQLDMPIAHCHCRTCRKAHAAAFASTAGVRREHFRWLKGEEQLTAFESSPGKFRHFCSVCGAHLMAERPAQPHVILRVATLDDDPGSVPAMRIWRSHDVVWLQDGSDVPSYQEWQPDR